jgi:hypothetical protein
LPTFPPLMNIDNSILFIVRIIVKATNSILFYSYVASYFTDIFFKALPMDLGTLQVFIKFSHV